MKLKDMTFLQVLQLSIFQEELKKQLDIELQAYQDVSKRGKLKRMAMDRLREKGLFNVKDLTTAYYHIMHKEADKESYPANERQYICDVCTLAYTRTIRKLQAESDWNKKHPVRAWLRDIWERIKKIFNAKTNE